MFPLANVFILSAIMILSILHEDQAGSGKPLNGIMIIEMLKKYRMLPKGLIILSLINSIIGFGFLMSIHNIGYYLTLKYKATSGELGGVLGVHQLLMGLMMPGQSRIVDGVGGIAEMHLLITIQAYPY